MSTTHQKYIDKIKKINTEINIELSDDKYIISNAWKDKSFQIECKKSNLKSISNVRFVPQLFAIYHTEIKELEYIFTVLSENEPLILREFEFVFNNRIFVAKFKQTSKVLKTLAGGLIESSPEDSNCRNLLIFRDYLLDDSKKSPFMKKYFADKIPYSFNVSGPFDEIKTNFIDFSRHLNMYMQYFDRKMPIIVIEQEREETDYKQPCKLNHGTFPARINAATIDPTALELLLTARETASQRLKYIFYYHVLEYFAYYYLDEISKKKLKNMLSNPDLLGNSDHYIKLIMELYQDTSKSGDKDKLIKLLKNNISFEDIKDEILCNLKYFTSDIEFDGGFKLNKLPHSEDVFRNKSESIVSDEIIKVIVERIDKLRNVLVHIRESRENKVILPNMKNNRKLLPYIYLVRRIAELISIRSKDYSSR